MRLVLYIFLVVQFSALAGQAQSTSPVTQTFSCLRAGVTTNRQFNACLKPLDNVTTANLDEAELLDKLVSESNKYSLIIIDSIKNKMSVSRRDRLQLKLNKAGIVYLNNCLNYQIKRAKVSNKLALARCNMDSEFFVLHFYFDNARKYWRDGF